MVFTDIEELSISERLARLGYTHSRANGGKLEGKHVITKPGFPSLYMDALEAASFCKERERQNQ